MSPVVKRTRFLYWALAIHSIAVIIKMLFGPWDGLDGGGGGGAAILPVTIIFLLFNGFLGLLVKQISNGKRWARLTVTVLFVPWSVLFLIDGKLSVFLVLHGVAAVLVVLSVYILFHKDSNRSLLK